jgi:hypothetical protein
MKLRAISVAIGALGLVVTVWACGGSSSSSNPNPMSPTPTPNPAPSTMTVMITASGLSNSTFDLAVGGTVTFVNNDTQAHEPASNPHPAHTDCPALNVGALNPGESRATGALTVARACGFHDHMHADAAAWKGTITIR